jgi:hypothetical protein
MSEYGPAVADPAERLGYGSHSQQPFLYSRYPRFLRRQKISFLAGVGEWFSTSSAAVSLQPFFHLLPQPQPRVSKHDACCSRLRNISKIVPSTSCHLCPKALISPFPITMQHALDHIRWFRLTCVEWLYRYLLPTDRASRTNCGCLLHGQDAF